MATIEIQVSGLAAIEARLSGMLARSRDLSPLMDRIGMAMETTTRERFEEGVSPAGSPWKQSERAKKEGGKTLLDTGRLSQSVTHRASPDRVEIGTNVIYGARHQFGFSGSENVKSHSRTMTSAFGRKLRSPMEVIVPQFSRSANTPARPFLGLSSEDETEIGFLVEDFLLEGDGE